MGSKTGIEWTDATWNPIRGCTRVSEGCRNCYAESVAYRFSGQGQPYEGLAVLKNGHASWTGKIEFVEKHLLDPLKWKKPKRIFVNSMSDLFHENVTDEMRDKIFAVMALCPQHIFQVLTKRPERMRAYLLSDQWQGRISFAMRELIESDRRRFEVIPRGFCESPHNPSRVLVSGGVFEYSMLPLPNVWLGVSVENQETADERIPLLLQTPAAVRFISAEPLLGPVDLRQWVGLECRHEDSDSELDTNASICRECDESALLDWVICGGESGPGARPMHPEWAQSLRDQCRNANAPFFFKQWGEWGPVQWISGKTSYLKISVPSETNFKPSTKEIVFTRTDVAVEDRPKTSVNMVRVGKHAAGALLDGREWKQFPEAAK